jgi:hypothetical protein
VNDIGNNLVNAAIVFNCQGQAFPYSRASLLGKNPKTRRVLRHGSLAGSFMPTLFLFPFQLSKTRAFVASHKPQNRSLPNRRLRVPGYVPVQPHGPGEANIFGESDATAMLSK